MGDPRAQKPSDLRRLTPAFEFAEGASGHLLVCSRSSVLSSYDIVKRVVTVKQVRPSPLGVRSGLGMGMRGRCASIGGAVPAPRSQDAMIGRLLSDAAARSADPWSGSVPSDI